VTTPDVYDLQRFLDAQRECYESVVRELRAGRKETHWMWYIFPQIRGLGSSAMAQKYAISCLTEAQAFLGHPVLGSRLRECTQIVSAAKTAAVEDIFGYPDDRKFHASMTLFAHACTDNQFLMQALQKYFHSQFDPQTLERLK
jgi:uncharacterized protein (DUF1810 family)